MKKFSKNAMVAYIKNGKDVVKRLSLFNIEQVFEDIFDIDDDFFTVRDNISFVIFKNVSFSKNFEKMCMPHSFVGKFFYKYDSLSGRINFDLNEKDVCFDNCKFDNNLYIKNGSVQFIKPIFNKYFPVIYGDNLQKVKVTRLVNSESVTEGIIFWLSASEFELDANYAYFELEYAFINKMKLSNISPTSKIHFIGKEVEINNSDIYDLDSLKIDARDKLILNNTSLRGCKELLINSKAIEGNNFTFSSKKIIINEKEYRNLIIPDFDFSIINHCKFEEMIARERLIACLKGISNSCSEVIEREKSQEASRYQDYIAKEKRKVAEAEEYSDECVKKLEKKMNNKSIQSYFGKK